MPVISVNQYPQKISVKVSKPYLISVDFTSLSTVYLGTDSSVSSSNYGVKLSAGSNLTWNEINSEVWAVTDTGGAANVSLIYEASGSISGTTSNLASVYPKLLQTKIIAFNAATTGSTAVDTFLDNQIIQGFAGVRIQISVTITTVGTGLAGIQNGAFISFGGIQSNTTLTNSTTSFAETNDALWSFGNPNFIGNLGLMSAIQTYDFPVINTWLTSSWIRYSLGGSETTAAGNITVRIYGLYNVVVPQERYQNYWQGSRNATRGLLYTAAPTASISATDLNTQNGLATLTMAPATTGLTTVTAVLTTYSNDAVSVPLFRGALTSPAVQSAGQTYQIQLPNAPITFAANIAGTGTANYSLVTTKV